MEPFKLEFSAERAGVNAMALQQAYPKRAFRQLNEWCDPVRRLVSEGPRPLLPWGMQLSEIMETPDLTSPLLEKLCADPSDYVRLSVSNDLNDFSKQHPELVVKTLQKWRKQYKDGERFEKLARHVCRTLIKEGDSGALSLMGFGLAKNFELRGGSLPLSNSLRFLFNSTP